MNRSTLAPSLMIAFALIGLAVAFYNSYSIYNGQLLWCPPPINGCNELLQVHMRASSICPSDITESSIIFTCLVWRRCSHMILYHAGCGSEQFFTLRLVCCSRSISWSCRSVIFGRFDVYAAAIVARLASHTSEVAWEY